MVCWFWNISLDHRGYFAKELREGRLRQGWGYRKNFDLHKLKSKLDRGLPLNDEEWGCWKRCKYMIQSIEIGDLVVVKNIPTAQTFTVVKVAGAYEFEIGSEPGEVGLLDFGHFLPITDLHEYDKSSRELTAPFVRALSKGRRAIVRTLLHADTVTALYQNKQLGTDLRPDELQNRMCAIQRKYPGGEGPDHHQLKHWIADHPACIGLPRTAKADVEHSFASGDCVDITFALPDGHFVVVEIETTDPYPGAHQVIKYRALTAAEHNLALDSNRVTGILVAWDYAPDVLRFCSQYCIKAWTCRPGQRGVSF